MLSLGAMDISKANSKGNNKRIDVAQVEKYNLSAKEYCSSPPCNTVGTLLMCESCNRSLALLSCLDCRVNLCHSCSTWRHVKPDRKGHKVVLQSPVPFGAKVIHLLKDENKGLHNERFGASIQRIQSLIQNQINLRSPPKRHSSTRQSQIQRDMESKVEKTKQRELIQKKRQTNIAGLNPTQRKAAAIIQSLGHSYLNRKELERRSEVENNFNSAAMAHSTRTEHSSLQIQRFVRGWSVRLYMKKKGIDIRKCSLSDKATIMRHVCMDSGTKRKHDRNSSISTLNSLCNTTKRNFQSDLACGLSFYTKGEEKRLKYRSRVEILNENERKIQVERVQSGQLPSNEAPEGFTKQVDDLKEIESLNASLAEIKARLTPSLTLHRLAKRQCHWAKLFLRHVYIRQAVNTAWKAHCNNKFKWLEDESAVLRRIESFCTDRLKEIPENEIEYKFFKQWLEDQINRIAIQFRALDEEQESILEAEIQRIRHHCDHGTNQKHLSEELVFSYKIEEQFELEWVGAELGVVKCPEGSENRVRFMEWCTELRKKQESIREKLQMQLQTNLTNEYEAEEAYIMRHVIVSGDTAGASIEDLQSINARIANPFQPLKHIKWATWYDVYKRQPWLSMQAEATAANLQDRARKFQELDTMKAQLDQFKASIVNVQRNIADMSRERDLLDAAVLKDDEVEKKRNLQEMQHRDTVKRRLLQLKDLLEKENDILKHEINGYEQSVETISILQDRIEKEILSEQVFENKRNKLMAEFQLREYSGAGGKEKDASAPIQMSKKAVKKETKLLKKEQARLRALYFELRSGNKRGGGGRKTTSGESAQVALEIERKAKIAGIERQLEDGKIALSLLKTSPTSHEASMTILRLQAEAKAKQSSEVKDIQVQQEKLRKGREMLMQKATATQKERLREYDEVQKRNNTLKDDGNDMIEPEQDSSVALLPQLQRQEEETSDFGDLSVVSSPRLLAKKTETTKPVPDVTQTSSGHYGIGYDTEKDAIRAAILKRQIGQLRTQGFIGDLKFTVGKEEWKSFTAEQHHLKAGGFPYFEQVKKELGSKTYVYIWKRTTYDPDQMLTDIHVSIGDKEHTFYTDLSNEGFEEFSHNSLMGSSNELPCITVWGKRNPNHSAVLDAIDISFAPRDEKWLKANGFQKINVNLAQLNARPDSFIWCKYVQRTATGDIPVKHIRYDLNEVEERFKLDPENVDIRNKVKKLKRKLKLATENEERQNFKKEDSLEFATDAFALSSSDVDIFYKHFSEMGGSSCDGFISVEIFFKYLEWTRNEFSDHLFVFLQAANENEMMEFGDFVKSVCTYSLFGRREILTYAYKVLDKESKGSITFDDIIKLINMLHNKINKNKQVQAYQVERSLRDSWENRKISYKHFMSLDLRYPKIFFTVTDLQKQIQAKFLGKVYWKRKMLLFKDVKEEIEQDMSSKIPNSTTRNSQQ